jgi:hypothetical protein
MSGWLLHFGAAPLRAFAYQFGCDRLLYGLTGASTHIVKGYLTLKV